MGAERLAKRIYKLLKTWSADNFRLCPERSFSMPVRIISMRAIQVMVDLVIDLLDRIASEAASILKLEGKEILTVHEIHTGARLVLQDCKDGVSACHPVRDWNLVRYATSNYTQYMS